SLLLLATLVGAAPGAQPKEEAPATSSASPGEEPANDEGDQKGDVVPGVVRYVDSSGEVHYTNDPAAVPRGSRTSQVRGGQLSEISHRPARAQAARGPETPPFPPEVASQAPYAPDLPSAEEEYWRGRFREANGRVAELEASLATDRELARQLEPFSVYGG